MQHTVSLFNDFISAIPILGINERLNTAYESLEAKLTDVVYVGIGFNLPSAA
jgi:hypothetical protein